MTHDIQAQIDALYIAAIIAEDYKEPPWKPHEPLGPFHTDCDAESIKKGIAKAIRDYADNMFEKANRGNE